MLPTIQTGDLIVTQPRAVYGAGDIVAYRVPRGGVGEGVSVIHRIVGGSASSGFILQGDNNPDVDDWKPRPSDIVGRVWIRVPRLGLLLAFMRAPVPLASLLAGVAVSIYLVPSPKSRRRR